jgi:hypothetical protein
MAIPLSLTMLAAGLLTEEASAPEERSDPPQEPPVIGSAA